MGGRVNKLEYFLVVMFGSSSWLSTNSIWMELPLLVAELPEGWSLPSYLAVIVQLAVLGPLAYSVISKCIHKELKPAPVITGMLAFGCVCTVLLALFWDRTAFIGGERRSVALFLAFFGLAIVNCTSNVLFMPYMAAFHHSYLTAYFVGMGLSALFPSVVSLIQG
uniref:Riboflavin transporter n=1 Tax=Plectus sambesii TaxID=2011161 RepID=A0A914XJC1_9BILA